MPGHKKEIRPGVWKLRVSIGVDPATGKYRYVSKTIEGGPRIADKALAELAHSAKDSRSSITIEGAVKEFLKVCESSGLAKKTINGYESMARVHIIPRLGKKKIEALTARDLDSLYQRMANEGYSSINIHHLHGTIRSVLSQAVKWGWVEKNVAKLATPPARTRTQASAPTPEELGQILTKASERSPQLAALFALCALTGARRGEALALKWSDYNRDTRTLTISRALGYTPKDGTYEKSTKTHGVRKIGVDETLEDIILSQMDSLEKNVVAGFEIVKDPYLFYGEPDGSVPFHPDTPTKFFRIVCDSLGYPYHLHQLRHFTATQLIAAGVDVRTVSGRLGHADASVTLRIYSHVLEAQDRAASEFLGSIVRPKKRLEIDMGGVIGAEPLK